MDLASKLQLIDLRSTFLTGSSLLDARKTSLRTRFRPIATQPLIPTNSSLQTTSFFNPKQTKNHRISAKLSAVAVETAETSVKDDIESLFSDNSANENDYKRVDKQSKSGASSISSGVRLENVSKSYKGVTVLKDVNWEVKRGEKVGLVGVNGAGKTTQLRIIAGQEEPDSGNVIKAKSNMKIAFLSQEFEVLGSRTVRERLCAHLRRKWRLPRGWRRFRRR